MGASLLQIVHKTESTNATIRAPLHQPTTATDEAPDMYQPTTPEGPVTRWKRGLHSVVGEDGVLMISLPRLRDRFTHSSSKLAEIGIYPRMFPGTDGHSSNLDQTVLDSTIDWNLAKQTLGVVARPVKHGIQNSSASRAFQALAFSHRNALIFAQQRSSNWTAIFEDDAVPTPVPGLDNPVSWATAFESVWALLPPQASFVRLGYCQLRAKATVNSQVGLVSRTYRSGGKFRVTRYTGKLGKYESGGCTTAYVVRKDVIPQMLSLFPCPCTLDCCWRAYFQGRWDNRSSAPRGMDFLFNIDTQTTPDEVYRRFRNSKTFSGALSFGIVRQDKMALPGGTTTEYTELERSLMEN